MADSLATTQDPVPVSHFPQDTLRARVEQFLLVIFNVEFGYGMCWIQYNWMDIVTVSGLCPSKSTSYPDETEIMVIFRRQGE